MSSDTVVILGAGPAGLTAAHELAVKGFAPTVFDQNAKPGGIARTLEFKGFRYDIGGHRYFSKSAQINTLWQNILGPELMRVKRLSRIYYRGRFFNYPLDIANAIINLGPMESLKIMASYAKARIAPIKNDTNLEQWITRRFGRRLFDIFFKSYTEKLWGLPCRAISSDWAQQRIRCLSLSKALAHAVCHNGSDKSLTDEFFYPRTGSGRMWQVLGEKFHHLGGVLQMNTEITRIHHRNGRVSSVEFNTADRFGIKAFEHLISSIPLPSLIQRLFPSPPAAILAASRRLSYRAFIQVLLIVKSPRMFSDQWIYVNHPRVKVGRIQNYRNWSTAMAPDGAGSSIGMEYFCAVGDDLWSLDDAGLTALAVNELQSLGLARSEEILDGVVVRHPKAYPVYDRNYKDSIREIRQYLQQFTNLQTIGRNGMHRYNNMDHAMLTGMLAARNLAGETNDLWRVNEEKIYLEEQSPHQPPSLEEKKMRRAA